jgi:site-specific DNA-methyltransferase (adenine-specific)
MSIDDICKLNVSEITHDDAILFIWTTFRNLFETERVINAWGFDYKTCGFVWVKKTATGKDCFGMGEYTRANPEICLIGRKGRKLVKSRSVRQLQYAQAEAHSKKPDSIKSAIIDLCGDLPRIELFCRYPADGWDVWGNEVKCTAELGSAV